MEIIHRAGINNQHADALSRQPVLPAPPDMEANSEVQVAHISSSDDSKPDTISSLLCKDPGTGDNHESKSFAEEQLKDPSLQPIIQYLSKSILPAEPQLAAKVVAQASMYTIVDDILYFNGQKGDSPRTLVPCGLQQSMTEEYHSGIMAGHFSGPKIYKTMSYQWWWQNMYRDITNYTHGCAQCAIVTGSGRRQPPPMQPNPVDHPFQIIGIDIMELP